MPFKPTSTEIGVEHGFSARVVLVCDGLGQGVLVLEGEGLYGSYHGLAQVKFVDLKINLEKLID